MARIAQITTSLTARTSNLRKGLKRGSRLIAQFAQRARAVTKRAAIGIGVAAAATGVALTALVNKQRDVIDEQRKFADLTGISTNFLNGLRVAAGRTGVEASVLQKGFLQFITRVQQIDSASDPALIALNKLGISLGDLKKLSPEDQFTTLSDAAAKAKDPLVALGALSDLLGFRSLKLLRTMREVSTRGIGFFIQEAERFNLNTGLKFERRVEAVNDRIGDLKSQIEGAGNIILKALLPAIEKSIPVISSWIAAFDEAVVIAGIRRISAEIDNLTGKASKLARILKVAGLLKGGVEVAVGGLAGVAESTTGLLSRLPGLSALGNASALAGFQRDAAFNNAERSFRGDLFGDGTRGSGLLGVTDETASRHLRSIDGRLRSGVGAVVQ